MNPSIVFVHGAWVTPRCWQPFQSYFASKGFTCRAPAWPHKDGSVRDLQENPPAELAQVGTLEIVDHYAKILDEMETPPILIGHSFGGLFVQMLLDRGYGCAGVAIDSAPPRGVLPLQWSALRSNFGVLSSPGGWHKVARLTFEQFRYAFVHTLPEEDQRAAYENYVVPNSGRIFFQAATAPFHAATAVNFKNDERAPLLLIAGSDDHIVPAAQIRSNFKKYKKSSARTDFKEFENRTHWIIAQPGWEEVADYILHWLEDLDAPDEVAVSSSPEPATADA